MKTNNQSPWGSIQNVEHVADGIDFVSTASHGGFRISLERFAEMPRPLRQCTTFTWEGFAWFEEDCDWTAVYLAFPLEFLKFDGMDKFQKINKEAKASLKHWHPEQWGQFFGVVAA